MVYFCLSISFDLSRLRGCCYLRWDLVSRPSDLMRSYSKRSVHIAGASLGDTNLQVSGWDVVMLLLVRSGSVWGEEHRARRHGHLLRG